MGQPFKHTHTTHTPQHLAYTHTPPKHKPPPINTLSLTHTHTHTHTHTLSLSLAHTHTHSLSHSQMSYAVLFLSDVSCGCKAIPHQWLVPRENQMRGGCAPLGSRHAGARVG